MHHPNHLTPTKDHYTVDSVVTAFYVYRSSAYSTMIVISRVHGSKNPRKRTENFMFRMLPVRCKERPVTSTEEDTLQGGGTAVAAQTEAGAFQVSPQPLNTSQRPLYIYIYKTVDSNYSDGILCVDRVHILQWLWSQGSTGVRMPEKLAFHYIYRRYVYIMVFGSVSGANKPPMATPKKMTIYIYITHG